MAYLTHAEAEDRPPCRDYGLLANEDVKLAGALFRCEAAGDNSYRSSHVTAAGTARSLHPVR